MSDQRFWNKVAVVTGSGQGIGEAIARHFAAEKAKVVLVDSNSDRTKKVAGDISAGGGEATFVQTDVGEWSQVKQMIEFATKKYGTVDILVNNAAIQIPRRFLEIEPEEWTTVLRTNLTGYFYCCKAAAKVMVERGRGRIVNISSDAARVPAKVLGAHYVASKGGVLAFSRQLALELAPKVNVNCVLPGTTDTPTVRALASREVIKMIESMIPLGKLGTADDVADAVLFLCSDEAKYITGATLDVSGGAVMP